MKRLILLISLLSLAFILTACGELESRKNLRKKVKNQINMNTYIMKY